MRLANFDLDTLRTFVSGVELGSFARAADRLGRSPSAVSLHLRRLEDQAGRPLLHKQGRGLIPTEAGEMLLTYARRLLALNDEAMDALRGEAVAGTVHLGLPQDFAEGVLPAVLARFAAAHPAVRVEVSVERTVTLRDGIEAGRFDLAMFWDRDAASAVARVPMTWLGPRARFRRNQDAPLPLVVFEPPCLFREAATTALDAAGIPWRIVFSSPALSGLLAAVAAGLGVTPRAPFGLPAGVCPLEPARANLPALPMLSLSLRSGDARPTPPVERLRAIIGEALRAQFAGTVVLRQDGSDDRDPFEADTN